MSVNRRRTTNKIEVNFLAGWLVIIFLIGLGGLFFVYLKNQQHAVGKMQRSARRRHRRNPPQAQAAGQRV